MGETEGRNRKEAWYNYILISKYKNVIFKKSLNFNPMHPNVLFE